LLIPASADVSATVLNQRPNAGWCNLQMKLYSQGPAAKLEGLILAGVARGQVPRAGRDVKGLAVPVESGKRLWKVGEKA
jgi:hypothetical protein